MSLVITHTNLLSNIFRYFSSFELDTMRGVCKIWGDAIEKEFEMRKKIYGERPTRYKIINKMYILTYEGNSNGNDIIYLIRPCPCKVLSRFKCIKIILKSNENIDDTIKTLEHNKISIVDKKVSLVNAKFKHFYKLGEIDGYERNRPCKIKKNKCGGSIRIFNNGNVTISTKHSDDLTNIYKEAVQEFEDHKIEI